MKKIFPALLLGMFLCTLNFTAFAQDKPVKGYYELLNDGVNALKTNDYSQAESSLKQAIKMNPRNWRAWQALSVVYSEQNLMDYARVCAKNAYEIRPDEPINKYTYGLFLENPEKVIAHYDEAKNQMIITVNNGRNIVAEAMKNKHIREAVSRQDPDAGFQEIGNKILARVRVN